MFFSKRKKLIAIEAKLDRVLEILDHQEQNNIVGEERNQQFLRELLNEKTTILSDENRNSVKAVDNILHDAETKIIEDMKRNSAGLAELHEELKRRDSVVKKELKPVVHLVEQEQKMMKEFGEKLEVTESEIRLLLLNSVMDQIPENYEKNNK